MVPRSPLAKVHLGHCRGRRGCDVGEGKREVNVVDASWQKGEWEIIMKSVMNKEVTVEKMYSILKTGTCRRVIGNRHQGPLSIVDCLWSGVEHQLGAVCSTSKDLGIYARAKGLALQFGEHGGLI